MDSPKNDEENERGVPLMPLKNGSEKYAESEHITDNNDDYDPHLHRIVSHPTTNSETLAHLLKGCLGTGILAMHEAFRNSGWLVGIIFMAIIGFICTYCFHVLVRSQYILCKKHKRALLTYPESMKLALQDGPPALRWIAPSAVLITDGFLIIYQLGVCICYIVFVAKNVQQLINIYGLHPHLTIIMLIMFPPLLGLNSLKNLKILAPFSTLANVFTFVGLGFTLIYVFQDMPEFASMKPVNDNIVKTFPLYFGTVLFALEAIGVVIALENNMQSPKSFGGVMNIGMTLVTIMYGFVGFFGYWRYGEASKDSITLTLPNGAEDWLPNLTRSLFAIAVFISYALQCYVAISIIWDNYLSKRLNKEHETRNQFVFRLIITVFTFLVAAAVPELGLFISLFGAFCLSILGLAFPAIMEICVLWPDKLGAGNWIMWKNVGLTVFALIGLVSGSYSSLIEIVASFSKNVIENAET